MLWTSNTPFSYNSVPGVSTDYLLPTDNNFQKHRIRLIRLSRAPFVQKTPRCILKIADIQVEDPSALECRALSYAYGRDDQDRDIHVNGKRFTVSGNLYDCLKVMSKNSKRWGDLWVDQICIDNSNTSERSRQVKGMGEIYKRAKEVVVWLGQGLFSDFAAVDLVLHVFEQEQQEGAESVDLSSDEKDLLVSFVKNPYFERLWAVQELVLGRDMTILVGDRELSWTTMISVYAKHIFDPHPASLRDITDDCTSLQRIAMARTQRSVLDIFDVINGFCKYGCSDPRDHLFGLLGLLETRTSRWKLSLTVDYSLSLEAVFFNFCFEMLESVSETDQLFDMLVLLAHAMGFEGVFYSGCGEDELWEFFRGAGMRSGSEISAKVRNKLQAKVLKFQEAAHYLAADMPVEYDILSGGRIL